MTQLLQFPVSLLWLLLQVSFVVFTCSLSAVFEITGDSETNNVQGTF